MDRIVEGSIIASITAAITSLLGLVRFASKTKTELKEIDKRLESGNERFEKIEKSFKDNDGNERLMPVNECYKQRNLQFEIHSKRLDKFDIRLDRFEERLTAGLKEIIQLIREN